LHVLLIALVMEKIKLSTISMDLKMDIFISMKFEEFYNICTEMKELADNLKITCFNDSVIFKFTGDFGKRKVLYRYGGSIKDILYSSDEDLIQTVFRLSHLINTLKNLPKSDDIVYCMKDGSFFGILYNPTIHCEEVRFIPVIEKKKKITIINNKVQNLSVCI